MNKTEITSVHASFKDAIKEKYSILLKALEDDKRIAIKWNEKKKIKGFTGSEQKAFVDFMISLCYYI